MKYLFYAVAAFVVALLSFILVATVLEYGFNYTDLRSIPDYPGYTFRAVYISLILYFFFLRGRVRSTVQKLVAVLR